MPVAMLNSRDVIQIAVAASQGGDPATMTSEALADIRGEFGPAATAFMHAERMMRSALLPCLVFESAATIGQVREAFRRINLGGSPIAPGDLERLLSPGGGI